MAVFVFKIKSIQPFGKLVNYQSLHIDQNRTLVKRIICINFGHQQLQPVVSGLYYNILFVRLKVE